jgi:hypothetical protein
LPFQRDELAVGVLTGEGNLGYVVRRSMMRRTISIVGSWQRMNVLAFESDGVAHHVISRLQNRIRGFSAGATGNEPECALTEPAPEGCDGVSTCARNS